MRNCNGSQDTSQDIKIKIIIYPSQDFRVKEASKALREASGMDRAGLRTQLEQITHQVRLEIQGQVAEEFDRIHTVERAVEVGSLDAVITPQALRPEIIARIEGL